MFSVADQGLTQRSVFVEVLLPQLLFVPEPRPTTYHQMLDISEPPPLHSSHSRLSDLLLGRFKIKTSTCWQIVSP